MDRHSGPFAYLLVQEGVVMETVTPTGMQIVDCAECGHRHPVGRAHCVYCGKATLFGHDFCEVP